MEKSYVMEDLKWSGQEDSDSGARQTWVQILALLPMASGTLGKYAPPSESQFTGMYNGDSSATFLGAVVKASVK